MTFLHILPNFMPRTPASHASHVCLSCLARLPLMPRTSASHASHVCLSCLARLPLMPRTSASHASHVCLACLARLPRMPRTSASHASLARILVTLYLIAIFAAVNLSLFTKSHYFEIFGITKHKFYNLENKIQTLVVFINRSNVLNEHSKQYFLDLIRVIEINISLPKLKFFWTQASAFRLPVMKFIWSQIFAYCKQELNKVYFDCKRISELKNKLILNQTILRYFLSFIPSLSTLSNFKDSAR